MKTKIAGVVILTFMVLAGYAAFGGDERPLERPIERPLANYNEPKSWMEVELEDVTTGKTFSISDFKGSVVIIETFAVWCPTCTKQQRELQKLHAEYGDKVVNVTLDVDPNESEEKVRSHVERNGFDWLYAVAPPEMTKSLIDQFGTVIVNAPSAPVVLICENGSARLLGRGVKSADKLSKEVKKEC